MVSNIGGRRMYVWRAVDDEGEVLGMIVQRRRTHKLRSSCLRVCCATSRSSRRPL